ncbi:NYN domain-containing protein [Isosphaeraceae bacterium EP7]
MRTLIDGYNLMYANGLLDRKLGPDGLRKARTRFLNTLAVRLGPVDAHAATVVFDAAEAPHGLPSQAVHKGITVLYAVDEDDADERIELLILGHNAPKTLTVVSTDRRIRTAATRRKAHSVTSEEYWTELDGRKERADRLIPRVDAASKHHGPSHADAEYWLEEFADLATDPEVHRQLAPEPTMLTDAEIVQMQRDIDREFGEIAPPATKKTKKKG